MKRKDFIALIEGAMERIETGREKYCCFAISRSVIADDFWKNVFRREWSCSVSFKDEHYSIFKYCPTRRKLKQMRLNALAMYLAQSLAFKTYREF